MPVQLYCVHFVKQVNTKKSEFIMNHVINASRVHLDLVFCAVLTIRLPWVSHVGASALNKFSNCDL
jgi:hypothetical protein